MSLGRQGRHYLLVGGIQWLLDWSVTVALSHFGLAIAPANLAGRVSGALLGYWLNGKLTFAGEGHALGRKQLLRFLMMWVCTTALSTWAMSVVDARFGLTAAWLAKPAIEIALAVVGFLLSRHWIYKR